MRVVCWNIERGYRPTEIVQELRDLAADVYLLYELDRGVRRTKGVDMYATIEKGLGLNGEYVREFREVESVWRSIIPWGGPGGGEIGNAVFSRFPIDNYRVVDLPTRAPLTYDRSTLAPELFQPREGCRKAQVFTLEANGTTVTVVSTHLELWRSGWNHRRSQLEAAISGIKPGPMILAGDFNSVSGAANATIRRAPGSGEVHEVRNWLAEHNLHDPFPDADTTSGRLGIHAKIDWIAATPHLKAKTATMRNTGLSDHRCLVIDYDPF